MAGAVPPQCPHLPLPPALAAELRLAAERLLGDQGVRTGAAGMDLVLDKVSQLEHVDEAHGDLAVEELAGAPVAKTLLAGARQAGTLQLVLDGLLAGSVEHRRRDAQT